MAHEEDLSRRPERVIILDADDPLTEIHGRFVWQDEHERVVDEVRRRAFADGFKMGLERARPPRRRRPRWRLGTYLRVGLLVLLVLFVLLMLPIVLS